MRKTLMLTAGAVAVLAMGAVGLAAVAHEGGHGRHGGYHHHDGWHHDGWHHDGWGQGKHRLHRKLGKLKKLDTNGDGTVTLEEYLKPKEERFAELDAAGNGNLSAEALVGRERAALEYRIKRMLKRYDADGDGRISKEEFEKPARARFAKRDFNGDGKISDDELPPRHGRGDSGDDDRDDNDDAGDKSGSKAPENDGERDVARGDDATGDHEGRRHRHGHHRYHRHHHHHHDGGKGWHHGGKGWRGEGPRNLDDVLKRSGRRFDRLDDNKDGVIDNNEMAGRRGERIAYEQRRRMHVLDTNKDGAVSKQEFFAGREARFSMLDLTGDGKIAVDDFSPRAARFWERKAEGKQDQ